MWPGASSIILKGTTKLPHHHHHGHVSQLGVFSWWRGRCVLLEAADGDARGSSRRKVHEKKKKRKKRMMGDFMLVEWSGGKAREGVAGIPQASRCRLLRVALLPSYHVDY